MPVVRAGWFRAVSYVLIFAVVAQAGLESQLAYAQMAGTLSPVRSAGSLFGDSIAPMLDPGAGSSNAKPDSLPLDSKVAETPSPAAAPFSLPAGLARKTLANKSVLAFLDPPALLGNNGLGFFRNNLDSNLLALPLQSSDVPLQISVAFADSSSPSASFPEPWSESNPLLNFVGGGVVYRAGAIRLDNPGNLPVTLDSVTVDLGRPGPVFQLWQNITVPAGGSAIVTQTQDGNFNTSASPIVACGLPLEPNETRIPKITVTIAGTSTDYLDTAHVLDTGGFDSSCRGNQSLDWRPIGTSGMESPGGSLQLITDGAPHAVGTQDTVTVVANDAANQPLANVPVELVMLNGPNVGKAISGPSDATGSAMIQYSSSSQGTDLIQAVVNNASHGVLQSQQASTTWTSADVCPAPSVANAANSQLIYVGQTTSTFGNTMRLAAMLTDGTGNALTGRTLSFTAAGQTVMETTDANGIATLLESTLSAGQSAVAISFSGDQSFQAAQLTAMLTVLPAATLLRYTGSNLITAQGQQTVSAVLTDGLGRTAIPGRTLTFTLNGVTASAVTDANGLATTTLNFVTALHTGAGQLQINFLGGADYQPSSRAVPVRIYQPMPFVIWGGNSGGLRIGQRVNFWGAQWESQVIDGLYFGANASFKGWSGSVASFSRCEANATLATLDMACWQVKPGQSFPPDEVLPADIEVVVSTVINKSGDTVFGNIACGAIVQVDHTPLYGAVPGQDGFGTITAVNGDCAGVFPKPAVLAASQQQKSLVLPGEKLSVDYNLINQGATDATAVVLNENFDQVTPSTGSADLGTIAAGLSTSGSFPITVPAIPPRQASETTVDYSSRLAAQDGRLFSSEGEISFTDPFSQLYTPVDISSFSQLTLPRLTAGLSGPSCVAPNTTLPYQITLENVGSSTASKIAATLTLPDSTLATPQVPDLVVGTRFVGTMNWQTPGIAPKAADETTDAYLARLHGADGSTLPAAVLSAQWQDALSNSYGPVDQPFVTLTQRIPIVSTTTPAAQALLPNQKTQVNFNASNSGTGNAVQVTLKIKRQDGTFITVPNFSLPGGQSTTATASYQAPALAAKGASESDAAYISRLQALNNTSLNLDAILSWTDPAQNTYGPTDNPFTATERLPILSITLDAPANAQAGNSISYSLTASNIGTATAPTVSLTLTLPNGTIQQIPVGPLAGGGTFQTTVNYPIPIAQSAGSIAARLSASWSDAVQNSYGPLSANAATAVIPAVTSLTLAPAIVGPDVTGTTQTMTATATTSRGTPVSGIAVQFAVTGSNPVTGNAITDETGTATFSYTGTNSGTDTVVASFGAIVSNAATVIWNIPVQNVSTSTVFARFLPSSSSCLFEGDPNTPPVFLQEFPTINFNPPFGTVPGNTSNIGVNTRPFTDVTTDVNGNFTGTIIAQGNGLQAGVGSLSKFHAVFTGSLTVANAGNVTLSFFSDDGFILGVGGGATRVSGPMVNPPGSGLTAFENLPVIASFNQSSPPVGNAVVVNFPSAGHYPYELDYTECLDGPLTLTMAVGAADSKGVPPSGSLALSPINPPTLAAGQTQTFTVKASDVSGAPVVNKGVALIVNGANPQQLSSTTDSTGLARFSYSAANAGNDSVQAVADIDGLGAFSNVVNVSWPASALPGPAVNAGSNQTITLPVNAVTLNGTASEAGVPTSALGISWSMVSGPAPVIFSNPHQLVTQATFTVAGSYDLRLTANDTRVFRSSDVIITVNAEIVGSIEACYSCNTDFGFGKLLDGPTFVVHNTSTADFAAGVFRIGPGGGLTDSFHVGAVPAGASFTVAPGLSNDGGSGHTFFKFIGALLDTSDVGPHSNDTQFEFTALAGPFQIDSGVFTPAATQGRSVDGFVGDITFLGGPNGFDGCFQCFDKIVANLTISRLPVLVISKTHSGNFIQGQQNATYTLTVSNPAGSAPTSGPVTLTEALPPGLTFISMAGTGWSCSANTCTRSDVLEGGASYPSITVTVNVPGNATSPQVNTATVSGGGFTSASTIDPTTVTPPGPQLTQVTPGIAQQGQQNLTVTIVGQSTHFVQGTTFATFGPGITVAMLTVNSPTTATAVVNVAPTASVGTSDVALTTGGEVATLTGAFGVTNGGSAVTATQGWIGQPANGTVVQSQVPITIASGVTLTSGILDFWPASNPNNVQVINSNTTGSGTVGTFDATVLANGSYIVRLTATNANGSQQISLITLNVIGENKPGRVVETITDFRVPAAGIPITIARTYDSLERSRVEDFGFGWALVIGTRLEVDSQNNVSFTFNGRRVTFFFAPRATSFLFPWLLIPSYIPQTGFHGTLTSDGCGGVLQVPGGFSCFPSGPYQPTTYTYTDPYGRVYVLGADGNMKSIKDLNGNTLTFTPDGITSSAAGMTIPFVRDNQGRITQIRDANGNAYNYSYDAAGDLASVAVPATTNPVTYSYTPDHLLLSQTDPRGNSGSASYDSSGRLETVTDALGNVTHYAYDVVGNTTRITNPDGGVYVITSNSFGKPTSVTNPLGHTASFTYDSDQNLTSHTNALGKTKTYTYDATGNVVSITDPLGNVTRKQYDTGGKLLSVTNPIGQVQQFGYDDQGNPASLTDLLGTLMRATYDARGNRTSLTIPNAATAHFAFDSFGNAVSIVDHNGFTSTRQYDLMGHWIDESDSQHGSMSFQYDALGRLTQRRDPLGNVLSYSYDQDGNRTGEIDPNGNSYSRVYDAVGNEIRTIYPDGASVTRTYDWAGRVLSETDASGHITRSTYDLAGQLTSLTVGAGTADEATMSFTYDAAGRLGSLTDGRGNSLALGRDDLGRVITETDALGGTTRLTYDALGQLAVITAPLGAKTQFSYDARHRRTTMTNPDGTAVHYSYDALTPSSVTDEAGKTTSYTYNPLTQITSVSDALGHKTDYVRDAVGNLVGVIDPNGHRTNYAYDTGDRMIRKTLADGSFEQYTYDANGNLIAIRLRDGNINRYTYDPRNRLTQIAYFDGQLVSFTYTPTGNRKTSTTLNGTVQYDYDNQDRLVKVTQPNGQTVSYTYDRSSNVTSITTFAGQTRYAYDAVNQLVSVTDPLAGVTTYTYDAAGRVTKRVLPNNVVTRYSYDARNRLTGVTHQLGTAAPFESFQYTFGPASNRLGVVEGNGAQTSWAYDDAYRLLRETSIDGSGAVLSETSYLYDAGGNRTKANTNGVVTDYVYNQLDQMISAGAAQTVYDGRGNLVQVADPSGTTSYSFDAANRLVSVNLPGLGTAASYTYDADGWLSTRSANGTFRNFTWDPLSEYGDVLLESDATGAAISSYTRGQAGLIQQIGNANGWVSYYLQDGLGSIVGLTDSDGAETDQYRYDAFGIATSSSGNTINPYRYRGERLDDAIGLLYLRSRYYSPRAGRFITSDTANFELSHPVDLNRYAYVGGNPINSIDPSGHDAVEYGLMADFAENAALATGYFFGRAAEAWLSCAQDAVIAVVAGLQSPVWRPYAAGHIVDAGLGGKGSDDDPVVSYGLFDPAFGTLAEKGIKLLTAGREDVLEPKTPGCDGADPCGNHPELLVKRDAQPPDEKTLLSVGANRGICLNCQAQLADVDCIGPRGTNANCVQKPTEPEPDRLREFLEGLEKAKKYIEVFTYKASPFFDSNPWVKRLNRWNDLLGAGGISLDLLKGGLRHNRCLQVR